MEYDDERNEFLNPDEIEDDFSNDDLFNISSWGADMSLREIITSYKEDDIIKPELQRKYVWDKKEASRFIESILLGLPVPSIFLAKASNGQQLIVDGYQRIKTVCDFFDGIWSKDETPFKLTNSERINKRWRDRSYQALDEEDKRRFKTYTIHAIIFEQKKPSDDSGLYQIFERINTSGKTLNAQEIRNCVYQGKMNSLLFSLNKNEKWRALFGEDKENPRMLDIEFILRFFTLSQSAIINSDKSSISLKKSMNDFMVSVSKEPDGFFEELKGRFERTISFVHDNFSGDAFCNLQNDLSTIRKKFYPTVFDSLMIATEIALNRGYSSNINLEESRIRLLKDEHYRNSIVQGTMQIANIKNRISLVLSEIYGMQLNIEGSHE